MPNSHWNSIANFCWASFADFNFLTSIVLQRFCFVKFMKSFLRLFGAWILSSEVQRGKEWEDRTVSKVSVDRVHWSVSYQLMFSLTCYIWTRCILMSFASFHLPHPFGQCMNLQLDFDLENVSFTEIQPQNTASIFLFA